MPRINLLPTKAAKRTESARNELALMVALLVILLATLVYWNGSIAEEVLAIESSIAGIKQDMNTLTKEAGRVEEFEAKSALLVTKLDTIEKLKRQKIGPAILMHDIASILTDIERVWLVSVTEDAGKLVFQGGAMEHEDISEFQLSLQNKSKLFSEVTLALVETAKLDGVRYLKWKITCIADLTSG